MHLADSPATPLHELLEEIVARFRDDHSGDVATYIPELARANPDWFGISLATTDGAAYGVGASRQAFTIQSISKPFAYALVLEKLGPEEVRRRVGVEPSGDAFNSISLQPETGRPLNPMINAGAIAVSSMLYGVLRPNPLEKLLSWFSGLAGRQLRIDRSVYESERSTGHRNRAIAHLLRNFGVIDDPVEEGLDLYFQQCSILVDCHDLSVMAAALANRGINPVTCWQAMQTKYVDNVLSVMTTCGMYNYAGQWLYDVGMPAKSGVAGGILAVLPGRMGIAAFSPRLDAQGNSVRGIRVCQELSRRFQLHLFGPQMASRSSIRREMNLQHRTSSRVRCSQDLVRLKTLGTAVLLLELQGDLNFSTTEVVQRRVWRKLSTSRVLLIDFSRVDSIDSAGVEGLAMMVRRFAEDGREVVFAGVRLDPAAREHLEKSCACATSIADLDRALEACENSLLHGTAVGANGDSNGVPHAAFDRLEISEELTADEEAYLKARLFPHRYEAGQCICRKGDPADRIYFLSRGHVSVRLYGDERSYQRLASFSPGSLFGEIAAIDRGPRSADVWTESAVECLSLSLDDFDRIGTDLPSLKIKMLKYILRLVTMRLRRANDLIGQLAS